MALWALELGLASEEESSDLHFEETVNKQFLQEFEPHENKQSDLEITQTESDMELLLEFYFEPGYPNEENGAPPKQAYMMKKQGHAHAESKYVEAQRLDSTLIFAFWLQWAKKKQMIEEMEERNEELDENWIKNKGDIERLETWLGDLDDHNVSLDWGMEQTRVPVACRIWIDRIAEGRGDLATFAPIPEQEYADQDAQTGGFPDRSVYDSFSSVICEAFENIGPLPF